MAAYTYHISAQYHQDDRTCVEADHAVPRTIHFSPPPEFGGEAGFWTPEHFLLAAVGSCFVSTFKGMAMVSKLELRGIEVAVEGTIEKDAGGFRFTRIVLLPIAIITEEKQRETTQRLLEKAEKHCLVTRSLSSTTEMEARIMVEHPVAV